MPIDKAALGILIARTHNGGRLLWPCSWRALTGRFRLLPPSNTAKTESRTRLHERVLDTLAANQYRTYDVSNFVRNTLSGECLRGGEQAGGAAGRQTDTD